jgi:hypothetical protein
MAGNRFVVSYPESSYTPELVAAAAAAAAAAGVPPLAVVAESQSRERCGTRVSHDGSPEVNTYRQQRYL